MAADGAYRHAPSGMIFPAAVGDFRRVNLTRYDVEGLDVSAGYNLLPLVATVYVYPSPPISTGGPVEVVGAQFCGGEFVNRKQEIERSHPGAKLLLEEDRSVRQEGVAHNGKMARYAFDTPFLGQTQTVHSELYVFCYVGGKWAFEYRFSYPAQYDASDKIGLLLRDLRWTIPQNN